MDKQAFMIMPFDNEVAKQAYERVIKPLLEEEGVIIRRADEIFSTNVIYDDIVKEIQNADIIIVDISDKNPNVFYELGMSHILKQRNTIMITNEDVKKTPFDISHFRIYHYDDTIKGGAELSKKLKLVVGTILSDYKNIYKDELNVFYEILPNYLEKSCFITLIGLYLSSAINRTSDAFNYFGRIKEIITQGGGVELLKNVEDFIKIKFLQVDDNDIVTFTNKGMGFAELILDKKDFVCYIFNNESFEDKLDEQDLAKFNIFKKSYRQIFTK